VAFTGSSWGRRVKLTGLTPASTLSGYVAVITLDNIPVEAIDAGANSALNGGGDLRFSTDDAGATQLPCEVVSYVTSATAGLRKCEIHVRFSTYSSAAREVWMFYKKAGESQPVATDTYGRNAVWSSYHNSYRLNNTTDSAGNNDLTNSGVTLADDADFGSSETYLYSNSNGPSGTGNLSVSFKMNTTQYSVNANHHMVNIGAAATNNMFLVINYNHKLKFGAWGGSGLSASTIDDGADHYIDLTFDGTTARLYVDGVLDATDSASSLNITALPMHFGHYRGGGGAFDYDGTLDDLELYNGALSADLVATKHSNQSAPASFWTVGTPEDTGGGVTLEAAVSFAISQGFSLTAQASADSAITEAIAAGQSAAAQAVAEASNATAISVGVTKLAQMSAARSVSAGVTAGGANSAQAGSNGTHGAAVQAGFSSSAVAQVEATIAQAVSTGFNASGVAGAGAVVESSVSFA